MQLKIKSASPTVRRATSAGSRKCIRWGRRQSRDLACRTRFGLPPATPSD